MKLFVSYSRDSEAAVAKLVQDLRELGHDPWMDNELSGGREWWESILGEIRSSELFVAAISPRALASIACKRERAYAVELRKTVLPVLVSTSPGADGSVLTAELSRIQFVDYRAPESRDAVLNLARALSTLPPSAALPDPLPIPPDAPVSRLTELRQQVEAATDLSFPDQSALLVELTQSLRLPEQAQGARALLELFGKRPDLRIQIADEIERVLSERVEATSPIVETPAPRPSARSRWRMLAALGFGAGVVALSYVLLSSKPLQSEPNPDVVNEAGNNVVEAATAPPAEPACPPLPSVSIAAKSAPSTFRKVSGVNRITWACVSDALDQLRQKEELLPARFSAHVRNSVSTVAYALRLAGLDVNPWVCDLEKCLEVHLSKVDSPKVGDIAVDTNGLAGFYVGASVRLGDSQVRGWLYNSNFHMTVLTFSANEIKEFLCVPYDDTPPCPENKSN